ncbi:MAG: tetratricopeptide repeat protein, partial [Planctomycetota bacterium]|nr:tetratricopeptide repeat protein [Planctomycetota bacterium]
VKSLAESAAKIINASYGDKHPSLAEADLLLGLASSRRSDWAKASLHLKRALRLLKNEEGLREKELGQRCLLAFGELSSRQGRFLEARDFYNRAASYGKKIYRTKNHYMVARVALKRAQLAMLLGRVNESLKQCKSAETILVEHFGTKYRERFFIEFLRLQASFIRQEKSLKVSDAKELHESIKAQYGERHPFEDEAQALLARVYLHKKSYSKAETLIRALLIRRKEYWGVSHWKSAECQLLLGVFQQKKKELPKAYFYYLGALKIYVKTFDSGHPRLITAYASLGDVSLDQKKFERAEKIFQRALKTGEKTLGKESRLLLPILEGFQKALKKVGKRSEAKSMKERAAKLRETIALEDES